jgi:hypothetical protein
MSIVGKIQTLKGELMKILKFLIGLLIIMCFSHSALDACPTCWGALQLQLQKQQDSELVGEMEVSYNDNDHNLIEDDSEDEGDDGFNAYDKEIMEENSHE